MFTRVDREAARKKRHTRVRKHISGTDARPRLCVSPSLRHMTAQIIDDLSGQTLAAASTLDADVKKLSKKSGTVEAAAAVGTVLAQRGKSKGIETVVFDRGGYRYHGRVKALADAARAEGWQF